MRRPGYSKVVWFLGGLALGTMLGLIPFTAKSSGDGYVLSDRLATAEFMLSLFIAMALVYLVKRSGSRR
jgi:hypothetical protein